MYSIFAFNCGTHAHDVQVRDELENLLDDEEDMAEMYLTEKLVHQNLEDSSDSSMNEIDEMVDEASQSDMHDRHVTK